MQNSVILPEIYVSEVLQRTNRLAKIYRLRRASIAIPSNIAEGYGRKSPKEFRQFMSIAYGSALEPETQMIIAKKLKLTDPDHFVSCEDLLNEVLKMLNSMTAKLKLKSQVSTLDAN